MNRESRLKFIKKLSARPMPISYDVVWDFAEIFIDNLTNKIDEYGLSVMEYLNKIYSMDSIQNAAFSMSKKKYSIDKVSGEKSEVTIIARIDPNSENSALYNTNGKRDIIKVVMGKSSIDSLFKNLMLSDISLDEVSAATLNYIEDFITQAIVHELTHATDVIPRNKRVEKEFGKNDDNFYFSSREELKAHINETVYEAGTIMVDMDPEEIIEMSLIDFLEKNSSVYKTLKEKLIINPGDENINVPGGTLAKKKRKAWKQYLLSIYQWWTKQVERMQSERKVARIQRQNFLDPVLSKLINNERKI